MSFILHTDSWGWDWRFSTVWSKPARSHCCWLSTLSVDYAMTLHPFIGVPLSLTVSGLCSPKPRLVKAMVFPVVMYGCESWTINKAEYRRIDAFELWCWRRLLRVPWTARRSNQFVLKEIQSWIFIGRTDVEAETPILWLLDAKSLPICKNPDAGKDWRQEAEGDDRGWDGWTASLTKHEFG